MAGPYYVRSAAAGAGTGADWTNAFTTLVAAYAAGVAGDDFYLADDHAETQASAMALTSPGTAASPCRVMCVNRAGTVPPVSADLRTTATITTTAANAITVAGFTYFYGVTISSATGGTATAFQVLGGAADAWVRYDNCALVQGATANGAAVNIGGLTSSTRQRVEASNTTFKFGATGQSLVGRNASFLWRDAASAISGATLPTTLLTGAFAGVTELDGIDLSALTSGKTIVGDLAAARRVVLRNCKLGASVTVAAAPTSEGPETIISRVDSGATNYRHEKYVYSGSQVVETTIVRTNGAKMGSQAFAWKIATTANSKFFHPFESLPIEVWNLFTGTNLTVQLFGIWGGGAVPDSDDLWMEVEYLGSAATPLASRATTAKADVLAAATSYATDASTWGGSTTAFSMTATLTVQPAMVGALRIIVKAALASTTFYIDPKPVIQGVALGRQSLIGTSLVSEVPGGKRVGRLIAA